VRFQSGGSSPKEKSSGTPSTRHGAHRLEQAEHEPAALFPEVAVGRGIFEYGQRAVDPVDGLRDEVVVLGRLQRDGHPGGGPELARPHAGAVDDVLRFDVTVRRADSAHRAAADREPGDRDPLDDPDAAHARATRQ